MNHANVNDFTDTTVTLTGAWLPGDDNDPVFPIGDGYRHDHQREMYDYITNSDKEVILNTNPTGGGKTLSWGAPVIRSGETGLPNVVLAAYPTAALVQDQRNTLIDLFKQYFGTADSEWADKREYDLASTLDGELILTNGTQQYPLDERVQAVTASTTQGESTADVWKDVNQEAAFAKRAGVPTILLTTPDTLTLMAANRYQDRANIASIPGDVDMVVVDEFHLANPRGKRLLPFHLDTYLKLGHTNLEKLVFLSATPVAEDISRLKQAFNVAKVTNDVHSQDFGQNVPNWKIMPQTKFGVTSRPMFSSGHWLAERVETIEAFHKHPGQTLIVVDSIREVDLLRDAIESQTNLNVGQIYGWKKEGRQDAINNSDILIGNTAVEVGVDFQRVNRLICTAFDPNSALQRIGRMRARSQFADYQTLLISTPDIQTGIATTATNGMLTRTELDTVLHDALAERVERAYYNSLCGAYTRYLWEDADNNLEQEFRPEEASRFRELAFNHFGPSIQQLFGNATTTEEFWEYLGVFKNKYRDNTGDFPVFEEMHTYRDSSLSCLIIDATDPDEPLKRYSLHHVLRHRNGRVIESDRVKTVFKRQFNREPTNDEQWFIDESLNYAAGVFFVTGKRSDAREFTIRDYRFEDVKRKQWRNSSKSCSPGTLKDPTLHVDPYVDGQEHLNTADIGVLAQYIPETIRDARETYALGPYASACPIGNNESLLLWQNAILAHSMIQSRRLKKHKQKKKQKQQAQQP